VSANLCVVFDIDDTLYLERDYVRSGFAAVGAWVKKWLGVDDFPATAWALFEQGRRGDIFDEALRQAGVEPNPDLVRSLVSLYRCHRPAIALLPDASRCLEDLRERAAIAVVSDGPAVSQTRKAEALGLDKLAHPLIFTELWGAEFRKPHTRAFETVQSCYPQHGVRFVYVADNPAKDFSAPRQLGWTTIRVRRPGGLHFAVECAGDARPDFEVTDLSRVPELLGVVASTR